MKRVVICFLIAALFVMPSRYLMPKAAGQSWKWVRGITSGNCEGFAAAADDSGNVYAAGLDAIAGPTSFGSYTVTGPCAVWVKYDSTGAVQWVGNATIPSSLPTLIAITADKANNLIVFGSFFGTVTIGSFTLTGSSSFSNYYLAKINSSGAVQWAINDGSVYNPGTLFGNVRNGGVACDTAGNIYITSHFSGTTNIGTHTLTSAGGTDIFVAKYTSSGILSWANSIGGPGNDYGLGIAATPGGNVYITGCFYSDTMVVGPSIITGPPPTLYFFAAYIAKFSASTGSPLWAECTRGRKVSYGVAIASDKEDNVYMTGSFSDTSIKFGSLTATRLYPVPASQYASYLVKYSPADTAVWCQTMCSMSQPADGFDVAVSPCGEVWTSGNYRDTLHAGGYAFAPYSASFENAYLIGYSPTTGSIADYTSLSRGGDDQDGIACDRQGNVFFVSDYNGTFVLGADTISGISTGGELIYTARYSTGVSCGDESSLEVQMNISGSDVYLYPNPAKDKFVIATGLSVANNSRIDLMDLEGRLINSWSLSGNRTEIPVTNLLSGVYVCRITDGAGNVVIKKISVIK